MPTIFDKEESLLSSPGIFSGVGEPPWNRLTSHGMGPELVPWSLRDFLGVKDPS